MLMTQPSTGSYLHEDILFRPLRVQDNPTTKHCLCGLRRESNSVGTVTASGQDDGFQTERDDGDCFFVSIADVFAFANDTGEEAELILVEALVQGTVRLKRQSQVGYRMFNDREVLVIIGIINNAKDLVGDAYGH